MVCAENNVVQELPLPIAGLFSDKSMEIIARKYDDIQFAAPKIRNNFIGFPYEFADIGDSFYSFFADLRKGSFRLKKE